MANRCWIVKSPVPFLGIAALCLTLSSCQGNKQDEGQLKSRKDSLSYSIGLDIGRNLRHQGLDVDPAILAHGLKDMYDSGKGALTDSVSRSVTAAFRKQMRAKHAEDVRIEAEKNLRDGEIFLAANKKKDSIVALPSGLQYKILKTGTGKRPKPGQTVVLNFRGTLLDGTEFDNSYKRGEPATYAVSGVIKGWTEALPLMPAGSTWRIFVPPALAYGERGAGQTIPPNATLIFEMELLQIK